MCLPSAEMFLMRSGKLDRVPFSSLLRDILPQVTEGCLADVDHGSAAHVSPLQRLALTALDADWRAGLRGPLSILYRV